MDQEKIGKFIAKERKEKGITQSEFAGKLGVTGKTVSRWENGHYLPDISLFKDICDILDIDVQELLEGERKDSVSRETVDAVAMNLVEISNAKIKKNKRKVLTMSLIVVFFLLAVIVFLATLKKDEIKENISFGPGSDVPFPSKIAIKEKEDGWVCYFDIEYFNGKEEPYYYFYNCENFKYKSLDDYKAKGEEEDENGKYTYVIETDHPSYIYNSQYNKEISAITNYFIENKYTKKITVEDLDKLEVEKISKSEIVELYNNAIESPKISKFGSITLKNHPSHREQSIEVDGYQWIFGFLHENGHIKYVYIDLLKDGKYLSDSIKSGEATIKEKEIKKDIETIRKYIIEKQAFTIPQSLSNKRPFSFLSFPSDNYSYLEDY